MRRSRVLARIAGLTALLLVGLTAAVAAQDPSGGDEGVEETTTTETSVDETTTTQEPTTTTTAPAGDDVEAETEEVEDVEDAEEADKPHPENHGKYVSEAAKSCPSGPEHGACVRAVARSDVGKRPKPDKPERPEDEAGDAEGRP